MARETKVGLVAGLAFIVAFAVILANRGQEDPLLTQEPLSKEDHVVLSERFVPRDPGAPPRRLRDPGAPRSPSAAIEAPLSAGGGGEDGATFDGERTTHEVISSPATRTITFDVPRGGQVRDHDRALQTMSQRPQWAASNRGDTLHHAPARSDDHGSMTAEEAGASSREKGPQISRDSVAKWPTAPAQPNAPESLTLQQTAPASTPKPPSSGTDYVVLAGDTLYRIAQKHYGKPSAKLVRRIAEANRETLPDPDVLRVGAVLVLPQIVGHKSGDASEANASVVHEARPKQAPPPARDVEWYQVKKGDRYASIARDKLGDAARWRELFQLNKDKFPDPNRIRDGVLIRIPKRQGGGVD